MIELLKLCGFEENEIVSELPGVERVFQKLGINGEDIERGKHRLNKYYDMQLVGMRKAFGLQVRELVNTVLAREKGKRKILYGFMSTGFHVVGSTLVSKSEEVHVAMPTTSFQIVLGCIFDKIVPILEAAEQKWLKMGKVTHCANVKTIVGLLALDLIPKPDLLVTSGHLCDTAPKTLDLVQELYDVPTCCFDTCQDREFKDYPDSKRTIELSAQSMRELALKLQEVVGIEITDEMLWEAINARREMGRTIMKLQVLLESSDPLPISTTHEALWNSIGTLPLGTSALGVPTAILNTLYEGVRERVEQGMGVVPKGAPRIISLTPSNNTDPRLEHLVREMGIATIATEGFFPVGGKRYIDSGEEKPKDPYERLSEGLQRSIGQSFSARNAILMAACKRLNVDGIFGRFHAGCRTVAGDAFIIKDAVTRELGLPVLLLEWEGFEPRIHNEEQFRRRLEVFKGTLIDRRKRELL